MTTPALSSPQLSSEKDFAHILANYDTYLFDCDGVIWTGPNGDVLIDNIPETLDVLSRLGKKYAFVTNNATLTRQDYLQKFHNFGLTHITLQQIVTSGSASALYLKKTVLPQREESGHPTGVYLIGTPAVEAELQQLGISWTGGSDPADDVLMNKDDFDTITPDPAVGIVLFSFQIRINYKQLGKAYNYLASNPNCELILTNDDATVPIKNGVCPGEGALASVLYNARKNLGRTVVGKPGVPMMKVVQECIPGLDPARTIMVGDRLETDILFGKFGNTATMLVLTGHSTLADVADTSPHHRPDYIAQSLAHLLGGLRHVEGSDLEKTMRVEDVRTTAPGLA